MYGSHTIVFCKTKDNTGRAFLRAHRAGFCLKINYLYLTASRYPVFLIDLDDYGDQSPDLEPIIYD